MEKSLIASIGQKLMQRVAFSKERKDFFNELAQLLKQQFHYDRLCINLYEQQEGLLSYFTSAQGTIVSNLSPVRPAEESSTVAGKVIASRRPVIITDLSHHFPEISAHPFAEVGLTSTMAFPLFLGNEIIATIHCSFADPPESAYQIASLMTDLAPYIATCLGGILAVEQQRLLQSLNLPPLHPIEADEGLICHSKAMRQIIRKINAVAKLDIPVLIRGETGTGKTMLAQYIHLHSLRKSAHYVKVNCPSLSSGLFESELFGHAKGSFTGAINKRMGRFELAHRGTIFLDEIAELPFDMQSKLLQVLDDSSFERVGESIPLAIDVRVIAATNARIHKAIEEKKLRADLYHRIAPCTIELPPLRERVEDIVPLTASIARQTTAKLGLASFSLTSEVMEPLLEYSWPGNIRELRNVITKILIHNSLERNVSSKTVKDIIEQNSENKPTVRAPAMYSPPEGLQEQKHWFEHPVNQGNLFSAKPPVHAPVNAFGHIVGHIGAQASGHVAGQISGQISGQMSGQTLGQAVHPPPHAPVCDPAREGPVHCMKEVERQHILHVLKETKGVVSGRRGAAALLGLNRSTLLYRMRKLGITKSSEPWSGNEA